MNITNARQPQHAFNSVSQLCSYLLRHGNDGGVAISLILNEIRIVVGDDSGRNVRDGNELVDRLKLGSNKLRLQVFY